MIHPNQQPDGLHQLSPDTHTLIRNGRPTHTIRTTWHEGVRHVHVETHNQPTGGHMNPKPDLMTYGREHWEYERWQRDTLIWCAETMNEAAATIERCMTNKPTPTPPSKSFFERWYERASIATRLRYWNDRAAANLGRPLGRRSQ